MYSYTPEQADLIDHVVVNDGIALVEAGAGSGKSFMSRRVVQELNVKSGIYTAFNKAIVEEGVDRFLGTPVECKTMHALAYAYIRPQLDIKSFTYKCITEKIAYSEKRRVIDSIDSFFVSSSDCMYDYFSNYFKDHPRKSYIQEISVKYVKGMAEGTVNPTFNYLLKALHLMMVDGEVTIKTDIVILDEINDITAVFLEIFKLIDAPKKLGLGESNQAIYEFLNLVNGFEILADVATTFKFTQSFRCSESVARRIENKMRVVMDKNFRFKGTDKPVINGKTLYCTLTNSMIIDKLRARLWDNEGFTLLRKPSDIFAAPLAVMSANQGKKPYQAKYAYLLDVYAEFKNQKEHKTYFKYLISELEDEEITNAVKLLQKLASENVNLYELYNDVKNAKVDKNYTVSTVYTSKGLEYETVYIADDLNNKFERACNGELSDKETEITMKCYYVATSRCGVNLHGALL